MFNIIAIMSSIFLAQSSDGGEQQKYFPIFVDSEERDKLESNNRYITKGRLELNYFTLSDLLQNKRFASDLDLVSNIISAVEDDDQERYRNILCEDAPTTSTNEPYIWSLNKMLFEKAGSFSIMGAFVLKNTTYFVMEQNNICAFYWPVIHSEGSGCFAPQELFSKQGQILCSLLGPFTGSMELSPPTGECIVVPCTVTEEGAMMNLYLPVERNTEKRNACATQAVDLLSKLRDTLKQGKGENRSVEQYVETAFDIMTYESAESFFSKALSRYGSSQNNIIETASQLNWYIESIEQCKKHNTLLLLDLYPLYILVLCDKDACMETDKIMIEYDEPVDMFTGSSLAKFWDSNTVVVIMNVQNEKPVLSGMKNHRFSEIHGSQAFRDAVNDYMKRKKQVK